MALYSSFPAVLSSYSCPKLGPEPAANAHSSPVVLFKPRLNLVLDKLISVMKASLG